MRLVKLITFVLVAASLFGCNRHRLWQREEVPITSPQKATATVPASSASSQPTRKPFIAKSQDLPEQGEQKPVKEVAPNPRVSKEPDGDILLTDLLGDQEPNRLAVQFTPPLLSTLVEQSTPAPDLVDSNVPTVERLEAKPRPTVVSKAPLPEQVDAEPDQAAPKRPAESPKTAEPIKRPLPSLRPKATVLGRSDVVDASVLQVNDRFFTIDEVLDATSPELAALDDSVSEQAFRGQAKEIINSRIREMVTESLVLTEADKRLTETQKLQIDAEVEQALKQMIAEAGGSQRALQQQLISQGQTLKAVLADYRRRITRLLYLRSKFLPAISISRRELWNYYSKNKLEFSAPRKVQMQIIAMPVSSFLSAVGRQPTMEQQESARLKARERIEQAAEALRAGQGFAEVAKKFSRGIKASAGGLWPPMEANSFREATVEAAALAMSEGQISDIIETDSGFYIVKTNRNIPGEAASFEQAQAEIYNRIEQKLISELTGKYFQRLFDNATIIQSEELLNLAVNRAVEKYWQR